MLFLEKKFVYDMLSAKYPTKAFEEPVACTFTETVLNHNNSLTQLIQSVLGNDNKACLVGDFTFLFLKEPINDRSYSINVGITDFKSSVSILAEEMEGVTQTVAKELITWRNTFKYHFPFLEVQEMSGNWSAAFQHVTVIFVGWKVTLGNVY